MKKTIELAAMVVAISLLVVHNQELRRKAEREFEILQNEAQALKEEEIRFEVLKSENKALEIRSSNN